MQASLERKVLLGFLAALALLLFSGGAAWFSARSTNGRFQWVDHSHQVLYQAEAVLVDLLNMQSASRGYLLTGEERFLDPYHRGRAQIESNLRQLETLVADNPTQRARAGDLAGTARRAMDIIQQLIQGRGQPGFTHSEQAAAVAESKAAMDRVRELVAQVEEEERGLLAARSQEARAEARRTLWITAVGGAVALAAVGMAAFWVRRDLQARLAAEAERDRFFSLSIDLLCVAGADGYFKRVSPAFGHTLGWTTAELLDRPFLDFVHPDDHAATLREVERQMKAGDPVLRFENRYRHKGGSWRVLSWRSVPHGGLMYATARDITEEKAAADEIRRLNTALEARAAQLEAANEERDRFFVLSRDLMCVVGFDGYFKRVNPAFTTTLGWTEAELLARPLYEFLHPDDRQRTLDEVRRQQAEGHEVVSFDNRYVCKDGSVRSMRWNARPIMETDRIYAIGRDVTEEKAAEEKIRQQNRRLHAIFESLPGLCLVLTPDLRIVNATDAYLKATMTEREKIRDRHLFEVFPENPANPADDGVRNLRASLERVQQGAAADTMAIQKYDVRRPDGTFEERFWSPINSRVIDAAGHLEYIIHRVEDVTDFVRRKSAGPGSEQELRIQLERMEAEVYSSAQKIQSVNRQLEAVNRELEAFSYSVSHDLRAPLRHIDGFASLLHKNAAAQLDAPARRHLDFISGAARQMGRLIDDLLAFSRMGRAALQPARVDQSALVAAIVREGRYAQSHPAVAWRIDPLPPAQGDPAMLRQVWANLIDNAVKYSAKTPQPRIEISAYPAGADTQETVYFVRDNGAGFDPRYIDKLFGVFQRLHTATEFEGTGIGLANVRRIITRHGGRTWAEGRPGAGAAFYFSLPAGPAFSARNGHSPT